MSTEQEDLVELLDREIDGFWSPDTVADLIMTEGWRRLQADDETIERVAQALARSQNPGVPSAFENYREDWLRDARAAIAALLEDPTPGVSRQEPTP